MRGPLIQQLHSLAVDLTVPCTVVTASHLNCAVKQTFSIRCIGTAGYIIILSKCVKSYKYQSTFSKD